MTRRIVIETAAIGPLTAEIDEHRNVKTAEAVWKALPIDAIASRWGEEIYFPTQVEAPIEDGQETVELGALAYWPPGKAICMFFGRTPVSIDERPRAASRVNVFGRITGDVSVLKKVRDGDRIVIQKLK